MPTRPELKSNHTATGTPASEVDEPTLSEDMGAEARAAKVRKPKGSPQLWPFAQLPRRARADFFKPLRGIDAESLAKAGKGTPDLKDAGDLFDLLANVEDALRVVAVPDAGVDFDEWAAKADDTTLLALFQWYMDRFTPGEAKPSSS